MSKHLHINLFVRSEMRSPAPVRLRVMAPVLAFAVAAGFGIFAMVIHTVLVGVHSEQLHIDQEKSKAIPRHKNFEEMNARLESLETGLQQLELFLNARLEWGETLLHLADAVPEDLQFQELALSYPKLSQSAPGSNLVMPTNMVERGRFVINGRTSNNESVEVLLNALRVPPLDKLLGLAEVPPNALRHEPSQKDSTLDVSLFEMTADCPPRRFE